MVPPVFTLPDANTRTFLERMLNQAAHGSLQWTLRRHVYDIYVTSCKTTTQPRARCLIKISALNRIGSGGIQKFNVCRTTGGGGIHKNFRILPNFCNAKRKRKYRSLLWRSHKREWKEAMLTLVIVIKQQTVINLVMQPQVSKRASGFHSCEHK